MYRTHRNDVGDFDTPAEEARREYTSVAMTTHVTARIAGGILCRPEFGPLEFRFLAH